MMETHATTILAVRKDGRVTIAGDGQVTMGQSMIMKHGAQKVRRLHEGKILAGFAGTTTGKSGTGTASSRRRRSGQSRFWL